MSSFEKVIGYESIKKEMLKICDMVHNREKYLSLGAKIPNGILLYGDPGLGKSLMAKCFIAECGLNSYTIRKNKGDKFVEFITKIFEEAKKNSPSIIFLDDMDKFANEDSDHCDAEEYVAVQAGIDEIKGKDVLVVATVNEIWKLPESLRRTGRFDVKIEVQTPNEEDSIKIIEYYLSDKKVSKEINIKDIAKMMNYVSCAELESILNEAAITAAYRKKELIEMKDIVDAILRMEYDSPDDNVQKSNEDIRKIAIYEAGHIVMCETLQPEGIAFASIRKTGRNNVGGFVRRSGDLKKSSTDILTALGGKVAYEMYYGDVAFGCSEDIRSAYSILRDDISQNGVCGISMIDVETHTSPLMSENFNSRSEAVVHVELERYIMKARQIVLLNKEFLDNLVEELLAKETLIPSDIRRIREKSHIISVNVD